MINRRIFIKGTLAGGMTALLGNRIKASGHAKKGVIPKVAATWDNRKATQIAMDTLQKGGSVLDAVEAGARIPEADPDDMSVGYGGLPDREGKVTLDACIMDPFGNAGSVTYLQHIMHPVSVARKVMEDTPHVMLSGKGALDFALSKGFKKENLLTKRAEEDWKKWLQDSQYVPGNHDTIGILAVDANGDMAGACTTSGMAFKYDGRVGDSPILGAGMYVDNEVGGACATGIGEMMMKTVGSFLIVELMRQGRSPQEACEEAIGRIIKKYPTFQFNDFGVGYLAMNKAGEVGGYSIRSGYTMSISEKAKDYLITPGYYFK